MPICKPDSTAHRLLLFRLRRYAAGYTWPEQPDVWHDPALRRQMLFM